MTNKKRARLFKFLLVLYVVTVCYLCFGRISGDDRLPRTLFGLEIDKIAHFLMFLPFPILLYFSNKTVVRKPLKAVFRALDALVIGAAFAGLTELVQARIAYRTGDIHDFVADILALITGCIVTLIFNLVYSLRRAFK